MICIACQFIWLTRQAHVGKLKKRKTGHQVGKGQTVSAIRNERRGYARLDNSKGTTKAWLHPPPAPNTPYSWLPPGHTPYSWMHSPPEQYSNFDTRNAKRSHQSGRGARKSAAVKAR